MELSPLRTDLRLPLDRPFTFAQAGEAGVSRDVLGRMCREGVLRRVFRGVYVDAAADDTPLARAQALTLVVAPSAVLTDETAAWARGIDLTARGEHVIPPPLSIFQPLERTRVRKEGTAGGRRGLTAGDVEILNGLRLTTSLRTATDLGRLRTRDRAIAALDAMLRTGDFTRLELLPEIQRFKGYRGVVQLRELAPLADGRAESPAESVMRLRWIDARLPEVDLQIPIRNIAGIVIFRLDMGLPEIKYAAEYDGIEWHSSPEQRARDRKRRGWLTERGWTIDVLTSPDVFGAGQRAAAIFRAGIDRAMRRMRQAS